jgi:hypothetical protein
MELQEALLSNKITPKALEKSVKSAIYQKIQDFHNRWKIGILESFNTQWERLNWESSYVKIDISWKEFSYYEGYFYITPKDDDDPINDYPIDIQKFKIEELQSEQSQWLLEKLVTNSAIKKFFKELDKLTQWIEEWVNTIFSQSEQSFKKLFKNVRKN